MMRPYEALGHAIADARRALGLATQHDLAARMACSQQSVSRWEAGTHRPSRAQLSRLAQALELNGSDLRDLAGFDLTPAQTFVKPFPLESLSSEDFEQFVAHAAQEGLLPRARVRILGKSGHAQGGADIDAAMPDGTRVLIQCKRVARFGPRDVRAAKRALTLQADRCILALSRVASPETIREATAQGFELWDRDEISRRIRIELAFPSQERLVDLFFRTQREALLGVRDAGAWLSAEVFFRPFGSPARPFNHARELIGREEELSTLAEACAGAGGVTFLIAQGGMGKSRLLKDLPDAMAGQGLRLHFLSPTSEVRREELLRLGPGPKLMIVDDAHDRDGLGALFEFVADPSRQARLLLAARPYAWDRLAGECQVYGLAKPQRIDLAPLGRARLVDLARQVLAANGAPSDWAEMVVAGSGGSPLVTTMAAHIVARDNVPIELARSHEELRAYILTKFAAVIAGEFATRGEEQALQAVLDVLAVVQPYHPEDRQLLELVERVTGFPPDIATRAMRRLEEGGVAFRRGARVRLMPDVLGDFLIERSCIDGAGRLSPFAAAVFEHVPPPLLSNVMLNLGRLDWRRSEGDTRNSQLLTNAWRQLDEVEDEWDQRLNAVKAVAAYQPAQALEFVRRQLRRGRRLAPLSEVLRIVAIASGEMGEAAQILWEMARKDDRDLGPNPSHPLRVLTELCGYHPRRSLALPEQALAFGLKLVEQHAAWSGRYTPLDVLSALLSTEGMTNESDGLTVSFSPYFIDLDVVRPVRRTVIETMLDLLRDPRLRVATAAAEHLQKAFRGPIGMMGAAPPDAVHARLDADRLETLAKLERVVADGVVPLVAVAIQNAVAWLAEGADDVAQAARRVAAALPSDLEVQLREALGGARDRMSGANWRESLEAWHSGLRSDFRRAFPEPADRLAKIESILQEAAEAYLQVQAYPLIAPLLVDDPDLAEAMLARALACPATPIRGYAHLPLAQLLRQRPARGRTWTDRFIADGAPDLASCAAQGLRALETIDGPSLSPLAALLAHSSASVRITTIQTIAWATMDDTEKVDILLTVPFDEDPAIAEAVCAAIMGGSESLAELLSAKRAVTLLDKLTPVPQLGYWSDDLIAALSTRFPVETAAFFRRRVEFAVERGGYPFRAANTGPYAHKALGVADTAQAVDILVGMWAWLRDNLESGYPFRESALELMEAMFPLGAPPLLQFVRAKLEDADPQDLMLIGRLIRHGHHGFAYDHAPFVIALLERCEAVSFDLLEEVTQEIYCGASGGMRSGVVGQPMPRDVSDRDRAEAVLAGLSRLSPAYELYDDLRRRAVDGIERSKQQATFFEDEFATG